MHPVEIAVSLSLAVTGALVAFGWTDRVLALFNDLPDQSAEPARVVRVERAHSIVVTDDGEEQLVTSQGLPAVGDWVAISDTVIREVIPRWSALTRMDPDGGVQVLAANVDLVFITAPADRLSPTRVERELAMAWDSGARPVVLVTKTDLAAPEVLTDLDDRLVGVDVIGTSATKGDGVDRVRELLRPSNTSVFLGPSGAGKSTLANALVGHQLLATGDVRDADQRGRHTTTSRQMAVVPGGGILIDTPGLRSLGLASDVDVDAVFPEIEELSRACRFSDCQHEREPGCAVTAAADDGSLDRARLASFHKLSRELAADARRHDPLLRKAETSKWKSIHKSLRDHPKYDRG